jgi:hypothetical protein
MARAGQGQGQTGQETAWQGRVGNSRTSVRGRVVQCSKIELYSLHHDTHSGLRK